MANIFQKIQLKKPKRSTFDLSHDNKLSFKMGKLVPIACLEALPGDKFRISTESMLRMMPMVAPIMHKVDIYTHFFFVPNRILWPHWEEFIVGPKKPDGGPLPAAPFFGADAFYPGYVEASSLADYLGLPVGFRGGNDHLKVSALPFAAYQKVWYEYYRDQNLQDTQWIELIDGDNSGAFPGFFGILRERAWEHDYFTSALPFAQKGDPVNIPVEPYGEADVITKYPQNPWLVKEANTPGYDAVSVPLNSDMAGTLSTDPIAGMQLSLDPNDNLEVDFRDVELSGTINDLRTAFSVQKWLEKNARAGSRYVENLLAHFGIRSQDARLQRPEYIGGTKSTMAISEVLQTSETDGTPQGNMAGHGISVNGGRECKYFCYEHGWIIGIMSVRPKTAYFQGLPRQFSKFDRLDYYWPDFAYLGEQEIKNKEVFALDVDSSTQDETFGYIPRYSEYRYIPSQVHGEMTNTLKFWHLGRDFGVRPALNEDFIKCRPSLRIFAVQDPDEDQIVAHVFFRIVATRPLPRYGSPGGI